jgi:DNA topoisomerase III
MPSASGAREGSRAGPAHKRGARKSSGGSGATRGGGGRSVLVSTPGSVLVVAEKPSVARDLASVLGAVQRRDGFLEGSGHVVTWAIGHLVELPQPHDIEPTWKRWTRATLPMLPARWPLQVAPRTAAQFRVVARLLKDRQVARVVCATDAGREGELIFRFIHERAGCTKPVSRLWISSMTPDAIAQGFSALRPAAEYDALAAAARGRAIADWLVGMNLTRSYTLARGERGQVFSVGRVQTPTLAMLVERELAIRSFVPEDYREVVAGFRVPGDGLEFEGIYFDPAKERELKARGVQDAGAEARRLPADGELAERIAARARTGTARVDSVEAKQHRLPPPLLYDLTELQRHANRVYGLSAETTLTIAQRLYEQRKLITYPRSSSRHLSRSVASGLAAVVRAIAEPYRASLVPDTGVRALGARFVDDARVTDHHALIPTTTSAAGLDLSQSEARIYGLICRRLLSAWQPDHLYSTTVVVSAIEHAEFRDLYRSQGTQVNQLGWRALDPRPARGDADRDDPALPPGLARGKALDVLHSRSVAKQTRPPPRLTDAALLTAMETAGRTLDDRELAQAMREAGLGTPATRASIIETLIDRGYLTRSQKTLVPTEKGISLIQTVHPDVKSPVLTGRWEAELGRIERGDGRLNEFLAGIERYVTEVVGEGAPAASTARARTRQPAAPSTATAAQIDRAGEARWTKGPDGAWLVRAPVGAEGTTVAVTRRDGSRADVRLGAVVSATRGAALYRVAGQTELGSKPPPPRRRPRRKRGK